jgi:ribosomal protein L3 glutamine methyltransferase
MAMETVPDKQDPEAAEGLRTVVDFVRWAASRFSRAGVHFGHGTDNAIDEALQLVAHDLGLSLPVPPEFFHARLTPAEKASLTQLIERRVVERRPAAYLTGEAWFAGLAFAVDERVLVPRSPIAELIESRFVPWIDPDRVHRVLDLCTGSGCIGIACAHYLPHARVDLTDISADALAVAEDNIHRHGVADRVTAVRADVYDGLADERYDVIVSNPPYVGRGEFEALPEEYRHEPRVGLLADDNGLAVVKRIVDGAAGRLQPGGILVVEVGNSELAAAEAFAELPLTWLEFARGGCGVFLLSREDLSAGQGQTE